MACRFVSDKTAYMYKAATGSSRHGVLIYGDEVKTTGPASSGRVPVKFRRLDGFVREDELGRQAPLELYGVDVGQGDATFSVTPCDKRILIALSR